MKTAEELQREFYEIYKEEDIRYDEDYHDAGDVRLLMDRALKRFTQNLVHRSLPIEQEQEVERLKEEVQQLVKRGIHLERNLSLANSKLEIVPLRQRIKELEAQLKDAKKVISSAHNKAYILFHSKGAVNDKYRTDVGKLYHRLTEALESLPEQPIPNAFDYIEFMKSQYPEQQQPEAQKEEQLKLWAEVFDKHCAYRGSKVCNPDKLFENFIVTRKNS